MVSTMAYIGDVNSGQKPSTKRYAIIALVLVAVAIASMFFAKGSLDSRGHFTGPLVENGLKLYSGWNLISVPYSNVSIQKEGCNQGKQEGSCRSCPIKWDGPNSSYIKNILRN